MGCAGYRHFLAFAFERRRCSARVKHSRIHGAIYLPGDPPRNEFGNCCSRKILLHGRRAPLQHHAVVITDRSSFTRCSRAMFQRSFADRFEVRGSRSQCRGPEALRCGHCERYRRCHYSCASTGRTRNKTSAGEVSPRFSCLLSCNRDGLHPDRGGDDPDVCPVSGASYLCVNRGDFLDAGIERSGKLRKQEPHWRRRITPAESTWGSCRAGGDTCCNRTACTERRRGFTVSGKGCDHVIMLAPAGFAMGLPFPTGCGCWNEVIRRRCAGRGH